MILNGLLENDLIDHVAENIEIQKIATFAQTKNPLIYMSLSESSNGKYKTWYYKIENWLRTYKFFSYPKVDLTNLETLFQTHFISDDTFGDLKILRSYDNGRLLEGTVQGEFVQLKTNLLGCAKFFFFDNSCLFSTNKENCTHVYVVHILISKII